MGNYRLKFLTTNTFYEQTPIREMIDSYKEKMLEMFRTDLIRGGSTFYVIEVEGGEIYHLSRLYHTALMYGKIPGYIIEMYQPNDVCLKYGLHQRTEFEISKAIKEIQISAPPYGIFLIDATSIYEKDVVSQSIDFIMNGIDMNRSYSIDCHKMHNSNPVLGYQQLTSALTESNNDEIIELSLIPDVAEFLHLLTSKMSINEVEEKKTEFEELIEILPIFTPKVTVDYCHKHISEAEWFQVNKIIEYNHFTKSTSKQFQSNIIISEISQETKNAKPDFKKSPEMHSKPLQNVFKRAKKFSFRILKNM